MARMQAVVEAAHTAQGTARPEVMDAEPVTEPLPRLQAKVPARDRRGDAWTYRTDLPGAAGGRAEPASAPDDVVGAERPPEPRRPPQPAATSKPFRTSARGFGVRPERSPAPAPAVKPDRAVRPGRPAAADYATGPIAAVSPEPAIGLDRPLIGPIARYEQVTLQRTIAADWGVPRAERGPLRRHGRVTAAAGALVVMLIAAGVVALVLSLRSGVIQTGDSHQANNKAAIALADARTAAAMWVVAQVSHQVNVACDPAMCQALAQQGFPSRWIYQVGSKSSYPLGSAIVVETPTLRHQFGTSLDASWAPQVLAGFGRGADRITVRVIAPHGTAAYSSALNTDLKQRIAVGASLVASRQISTVPAARRAMAAGLVDSRLLIVITALASQHPIDILAFGQSYPGTTAGTPFRVAVLAESDPVAGVPATDYVKSMIDLLRAQSPEYRPALIRTVPLPSGKLGLQVQFAAPSPVGLLSPRP